MRYFLFLGIISIILAGVMPAQAALYDWATITPVQDAIGDSVNAGTTVSSGGQDIGAVRYAFGQDPNTPGDTANYHFFRMDLAAAPTGEAQFGNSAEVYGIYIDRQSGGGDGSLSYVPDAFTGIDVIIDSHFNPNMGGWHQSDYHTWNSAAGYFDFNAPVDAAINGATLEWKIFADATLGMDTALDSSEWTAAAHSFGAACDITHDLAAVPVPGAVWLLGSGFLGLVGLLRKPHH